MGELYDADVLEWSEHQARLLRRLAAGEPGNPVGPEGGPTEAPDWANIIEEVESVGRSQRDAVEGLWTLAFLRDLKVEAWPLSRDVPHWRAEARLFRRQAKRKFTPSMRAKIDVGSLYGDALAGLPDTMNEQAPLPVPAACPIALDDLLGDAADGAASGG